MKLSEAVDSKIYQSFESLSSDPIIKHIIEKDFSDKDDLIKNLLAGIVCVMDREEKSLRQIQTLIDNNPAVQQILVAKSDSLYHSPILEEKKQ